MVLAAVISIVMYAGTSVQGLTPREQAAASNHFKAGMQALASERWDRAETEFRAAIKIDPLYDAAFYGLGQLYMIKKQYDDAIRAYQDSRNAFKASAEARATDKVSTDRRIRDQIQAINDYVRSLERAGARGNPNLAADLQRQRVRIRQLEAQLTLSAGSMPDIPAGLSLAIGSAFFRTGNFFEAEREYLEAVRVDPGFGEAHNNLAVVYLLTNRLDLAEREIALAEKAGFKVSPDLKADLKKRRGGI
jgi:tetratricopeptide (TPR) repeat protein